MKNLFYLFIVTLVLTGCKGDPNEQVEEGTINDNTYHSDEIGWTIDIPQEYNIIPLDKIAETDQVGAELVENATDLDVDMSSMVNLVSFGANEYNSLESSYEYFEGDYEENNDYVYQIIAESFEYEGLDYDTSRTTARIDGLSFEVFKAVLYDELGDAVLHQELYSRLIDGKDFSVFIYYSHEFHGNKLRDAFKTSKFAKRGH